LFHATLGLRVIQKKKKLRQIAFFQPPWFALEFAGIRRAAIPIRRLERGELVPLWWSVASVRTGFWTGPPRGGKGSKGIN